MLQIYQLNDQMVWLGDGARTVSTKGHLQVLVAPPTVPSGQAAVWQTDLCPVANTPTFGEDGTGVWALVDDHRKDKLYTADGEYKLGDEYDGQTYNGLGEIPAWLSTEAPEPPEEPEQVPYSVSRAQGKAALIQAGKWAAVLSYVEGITDPTEKALAEVALNDTQEWRRESPFLNAAATGIGLSAEQLDDLFIAAAQIEL